MVTFASHYTCWLRLFFAQTLGCIIFGAFLVRIHATWKEGAKTRTESLLFCISHLLQGFPLDQEAGLKEQHFEQFSGRKGSLQFWLPEFLESIRWPGLGDRHSGFAGTWVSCFCSFFLVLRVFSPASLEPRQFSNCRNQKARTSAGCLDFRIALRGIWLNEI